MKYIIWDLINNYDGFSTTDCNSWDEVKSVLSARCKELKLPYLYDKWLSGKISKIERTGKNNEALLFVTTEALVAPVKDAK